MRYEATRRPPRDPGDLGRGQVAARALVGDGRVDVAVGDDDRAALQRRADDGVDVLCAVGGVQQGLGPVGETGGGHVQQDRPQPLADRGGPGLAGDDHLVALGPDPFGERLDLGGLARSVAALQGEEEAGGRGRDGRFVAAQRLAQVTAQRHARPVVRLGEDDGGDGQQQRAEQHQGEGGPAVGEDEVTGDQAVPADRGGQQRTGDRAERHEHPDDGLEVLGGPGLPERLGLLVDQGVPGVGGDPGGVTGEQRDGDPGRGVRHQTEREERETCDGGGQRQQAAARQGGQYVACRTDAEGGAAGQSEDQQREGGRAAAQVVGVQHGDCRGPGDDSGDGRADRDEQRHRAGAALVGAVAGGGAAQALQRGARPGRLGGRELKEVQGGDGGGEESGRDVGPQSRLVEGEPLQARAEEVADQCGGQQDHRGGGHGEEVGAERQTAQGVVVVGQGAYGRAFEGRGGQQRRSGTVLGHGPQALTGAGHEDGDEDHHERLVGRPVDPQRGDDQQRQAQPVHPDHQPSPVQLSAGPREGRQGPQEYGSEEQGGKDPGTEDGGDGEGRPAVSGAE